MRAKITKRMMKAFIPTKKITRIKVQANFAISVIL